MPRNPRNDGFLDVHWSSNFYRLTAHAQRRCRQIDSPIDSCILTYVQMFKNEMYRKNGASRWKFSKCTAHSQHRQSFSSGPGTSNFWTLVIGNIGYWYWGKKKWYCSGLVHSPFQYLFCLPIWGSTDKWLLTSPAKPTSWPSPCRFAAVYSFRHSNGISEEI